jgi:polyferredoxin
MGRLRQLIEWERRIGPTVNSAASAFYDWLSVVLGPAAILFGVLGLFWGHWVGLVLIATGAGLTWMGWSRLLRFLRSRT